MKNCIHALNYIHFIRLRSPNFHLNLLTLRIRINNRQHKLTKHQKI